MTEPNAIKTPTHYRISDPDRFAFATFYDADGNRIDPDKIVTVLNEHAALAAENERFVSTLKKIKRYVIGHTEPGYECVQCLIEGLCDEALKQDRAEAGKENEDERI